MRVALIASPFIQVPPKRYGGTELFIATLADGLQKVGHDVVIYANGESESPGELCWIYPKAQWPINGDFSDTLKEVHHTSWAVNLAAETCDIIHINNVIGLAHIRFVKIPFVYTIHHPHESVLSDFYLKHPDVSYVTISNFQRKQEAMPNLSTIHHGIDLAQYRFREKKQSYLSFLGRLCPAKGAHKAIAVAKQSGIPLKIAGEVQPIFRDYYDNEVKPHIDGRFIEYVGELDLAGKNEFLGNSLALLFPIEWDEPFGLVMIEAMACGTPVLALPGGSVEEVVANGVSGCVCRSVEEMAHYARQVETLTHPAKIRGYAEQRFSAERMATQYAELYSSILGPEALSKGVPALDIGTDIRTREAAA